MAPYIVPDLTEVVSDLTNMVSDLTDMVPSITPFVQASNTNHSVCLGSDHQPIRLYGPLRLYGFRSSITLFV